MSRLSWWLYGYFVGALSALALHFDRDAIDFIPAERTPGSRLGEHAVLNAIAQGGGTARGPDFVSTFVKEARVSERTVRGWPACPMRSSDGASC